MVQNTVTVIKKDLIMKKILALFYTVCLLLAATGCSAVYRIDFAANTKDTVFSIKDYGLQITADGSFHLTDADNFDLQITNKDAYISIYAYKYTDLPYGLTPNDIYDMQNEDIFSKRTNVTVIDEVKSQSSEAVTITYEVYSAQKNGNENYYATYLVDFPHDKTFAWVLVSATPEYFNDNKERLHNIVCSITTTETQKEKSTFYV